MMEEAIRRVPLFDSLPWDEIKLLTSTLRRAEYAPGEILFREGELGDRLSIVLAGEVQIVKALETPDEWIVAVMGEGEFIGEMSLLYHDRQRSASARALSQVLLAEMTSTDFDALLTRQPSLAFRIMQEMSLRIRNSEDATIRDLQEKNEQLARAYRELQAAQARLIEQEKIEHELRMARRIQEQILPKEIPTVRGYELAAYWQPARSVSGDFYDFIPFPNGKFGLIVGDVTDKGVPAALVMATTRSVLRGAVTMAGAQGVAVSPGLILSQVNELLIPDMPDSMFVTCLFAILDPQNGELCFANAGHCLPFRCSSSGVEQLRATGMPLGLLPGRNYEETRVQIGPGDSVLMYSDGLVEAHNAEGEMFGSKHLHKLLEGQMPEGGWIPYLLTRLADFTGPGWEQEDDVTFVTLKREGE